MLEKYKNKILQGDCLEVLKTLPDESIDMVMTSPPYWALRDYGVDGQLGLEPTFQTYINKLCDIFDEVKRVLKKEGTCWVNLGDTYGTKSGSAFENDNLSKKTAEEVSKTTGINKANELRGTSPEMHKCLCQIPSRFAIEMTNRGWILRNEIIWHKPNCMPSSVKDRFTVDFEKIFFFVKSKKYWFEQQYEPISETYANDKRADGVLRQRMYPNSKYVKAGMIQLEEVHSHTRNLNGRNKRTVWKITTKPYKEAHFATYPEQLCETPIKAGCPKDGIVLDPFFGAGTTGLVAQKLKRNYIGIELNPEYIKIAEQRLRQEVLL